MQYIYIYRVLIYWPQIYPHVLSKCVQTYSTSIPCIPVYTLYIYTETSYTR